MAKVKNKRNSGLADKVHGKKKGDINKKKLNPFEVHINKEKIKVLGKKTKHDRGLPGVSRAKAVQKRKETLGTEMKLMHKTNAFIDRRIGEKNTQLTAEDRMVARFAAERARHHTKKNIYNLADDEILTHRGQTLEQIEKFDDPRSSDDEEDEGKKFGGLGDEFVSEGHFGGGMLSRTEKDGAKSHKDLIEQLIAESKKRKAEKQKEKEQTLDLTEKLDSEWKDLQPVVFKRARVENEGLIEKLLSQAERKGEDYDKMMRELRFEKRGTPSDGLKTDEKQAKEEKLRMEQLEKERQQRMLGEHETQAHRGQPAAKHRSADDLDDNFELDDEQNFMLAYDKDGKPLVPEHILNDYSVPNSKPKFDDGVSDTSSEDGEDEESDDDDDKNESGDEEQSEESNDEQSGAKDIANSKANKPHNKKSVDANEQNDHSDESSDEEISDTKKIANNMTEKARNKKSVDTNEKSDKVDEELSNTKKKGNKKTEKTNNKKVLDKNKESDDDESDNNQIDETKTAQKAIQNKSAENNSNESSDNEEEIDEPNTTVKEKKSLNNKIEPETGLFQTAKNTEASSDEESEDEESGSEVSDEEEEKTKVDDLKDLKMSDEESDDGIEFQDTDKIVSFFDLKDGEGDNLKELLTGKTPWQQATAIQKLIKSYDPGLAENNKDKLSRLYAHMLQYINDIFTNLRNEGDLLKSFLIFDKIAPLFYDLAHTNKVSSKKFIVELLKEKHDRFKRNAKKIPDLDTLIFFKLVSLLYPTSDFRHPVTTPSLIFMSEILARAKFNDPYSISRGFFLVSLVLEYTVLSKRFLPTAVNFLRGILYLCANTSVLNPIQVVPPFRIHRDAKILNLEEDCSKMEVENKMAVKDLVLNEIDNAFKIRSLLISTLMLKEFFDNCNDLDAQECIFEPHIQLYGRIDLELYPKKVGRRVQEVLQHMKESLEVKTYTPLSREKKKPKALRLYEPDIQEVFTGSKSSKLPREQADRARLQGKIKKEMKGALREIRRDKAYIASVKIRQKIQSDNMRKEKVRQIYKDAAIQQGELNQMKRKK